MTAGSCKDGRPEGEVPMVEPLGGEIQRWRAVLGGSPNNTGRRVVRGGGHFGIHKTWLKLQLQVLSAVTLSKIIKALGSWGFPWSVDGQGALNEVIDVADVFHTVLGRQ